MRADMPKILTERPRIGSALNFRTVRRRGRNQGRDADALPQQQGMRKPHLQNLQAKELNEYFGPLRRFLEQRVGRPWNAVYAEICRHIHMDNAVQAHVRFHLHDFVVTDTTQLPDGTIATTEGRPLRCHRRFFTLYVCPITGCLRRVADLEQKRAQTPTAKAIAIAPDRELRLIDGHWHVVTYAPLPAAKPIVVAVTDEPAQADAILAACGTGHWLDMVDPALWRIMTTRAPRRFDVVLGRKIARGENLGYQAVPGLHEENRIAVRYAAKAQLADAETIRRQGLLHRS